MPRSPWLPTRPAVPVRRPPASNAALWSRMRFEKVIDLRTRRRFVLLRQSLFEALHFGSSLVAPLTFAPLNLIDGFGDVLRLLYATFRHDLQAVSIEFSTKNLSTIAFFRFQLNARLAILFQVFPFKRFVP